VILCPAHGAGSVCGGNIIDHPFTTAGYEKTTNPFIVQGKDTFVSVRKQNRPTLPPISVPWNDTTMMAHPCCTHPRSSVGSRYLNG
jgi:hypothetical protein